MALIHFVCDEQPLLGQAEVAVILNGEVAAVFEQPHGTAHARLGVAHVFANVDRTNAAHSL